VRAVQDGIAAGTWVLADKALAILGENTDRGCSSGRAIREQLEAEGWQAIAKEYFALDEVQF
jgi:hypothetical protein